MSLGTQTCPQAYPTKWAEAVLIQPPRASSCQTLMLSWVSASVSLIPIRMSGLGRGGLCPRPQSCPMSWGSLRPSILKRLSEASGQGSLRCWVLVSPHPDANSHVTICMGAGQSPASLYTQSYLGLNTDNQLIAHFSVMACRTFSLWCHTNQPKRCFTCSQLIFLVWLTIFNSTSSVINTFLVWLTP